MAQPAPTEAIWEKMEAPNLSIAALLRPLDPCDGPTREILKLERAGRQVNKYEMGSRLTFNKEVRGYELGYSQIKTNRTFGQCKAACRARAAKTILTFGT